MKSVKLKRQTSETDIDLSLVLHAQGKSKITTGIGFFDHMLTLMAFHGCFDLTISAKGDLHVDGHHTVEDVGIVLGQAVRQSLSDRQDFNRYASVYVPMDEALARVVIDISGRPHLVFQSPGLQATVGQFDTDLVREFLQAFVNHALVTLHVEVLYGANTHHMIEAIFKAAGQALRYATARDSGRRGVASTKGKL